MQKVPDYEAWLLKRLPRLLAVTLITLIDMPVYGVLFCQAIWRDVYARQLLLFLLCIYVGLPLLFGAFALFLAQGAGLNFVAALMVVALAVYFTTLFRMNRRHLP